MGRRIANRTDRATSSVVNAHTTASVTPLAGVSAALPNAVKTLASGALTANTLKSLISITGPGRMEYLACYTADATSRTMRIKVTVDGVSAVDVTSGATTDSGGGLYIVGGIATTSWQRQVIVWNSTLNVQIATSVASETDKLSIAYTYTLE